MSPPAAADLFRLQPGCGGCGGPMSGCPIRQEYDTPPAVHQYYYVDQGPTYTGPGDFAPLSDLSGERGSGAIGTIIRHYWLWLSIRMHWHHGYALRATTRTRYGYAMPHHYGYREHALRRYY